MTGSEPGPRRHGHRDPSAELADDVEFEREVLGESIAHDYSTSENGIVPLNRRRPLWHFAALWTTFYAGFSYLFVGFEIHDGGHSLWGAIGITLLGAAIYGAYAIFACYLGSRTGQTHALLTRSVFGVVGSWIVSAFVFIGAIGWAGWQANLTAQLWDGFYGWGHVLWIGVILGFVMVANNLLGFTGISVFARYIVTPLLVLWVIYLLIKGFTTDWSSIAHVTPKAAAGLGFWPAVGVVIGFLAYGNEPDIWRYGKPKFEWPLPAFAFSFIFGLLFFTVAGWMMAELAHTSDFAPVMSFTVHYSLFGLFLLAFILATLGQVAVNDSNYYESINAGQNIIGGWHHWRRTYTCIIVAGGAALAAWVIPYVWTNGFFKMANFLAITVVSATVIMVIDHFALPRIFGISRPLVEVPAWRDTAFINWPGVAALLIAVGVGAYASGLLPGESATRYWGLPPVEAWIIAGVLYVVFVGITRMMTSNVRAALGFAPHLMHEDIPGSTAIDLARPYPSSTAPKQPAGAISGD
jgi:purine-cytosine permease-like protein